MLSIILLLCVLVMARAERVEFGHEGNAGHRSTRKYDKICKSIHKQRINKRKTTESQRIEEEANWKNVQRVYGICVGNPLEMIFPNALCTLLAWPSRNSVIVEDAVTSLFRRDGSYIAQLLERNYFTNAARSRITTNLTSYLCFHLHVPWGVHSDWKHWWNVSRDLLFPLFFGDPPQ